MGRLLSEIIEKELQIIGQKIVIFHLEANFLFCGPPGICTTAPAEQIQHNYALARWQFYGPSIHLQLDPLPQIFAIPVEKCLLESNFHVLCFVEEAGAELLRVGIPFVMKTQAHIRVDANAEIVVHDDHAGLVLWVVHHLRFILALVHPCRRRLRTLLLVENDSPSVESNLLRLDNVLQKIRCALFARIATTPTQHPGQIIASAKRQNSAWRREAGRILSI